MRKWAMMCLLLVVSLTANAQKVGLKTNLANWALMGSPNVALEMRLADKWTLDVGGAMNLWKFEEPKELRYWAVQPELRYWFCETFNGGFIGLHGHGGQYNIGGWDIPVGRLDKFKEHRYEGDFYGAGLSIGYQWVLSPRWNLETSLGGGWARTDYRKYECATCGVQLEDDKYDYFGVTRATISLIYLIK